MGDDGASPVEAAAPVHPGMDAPLALPTEPFIGELLERLAPGQDAGAGTQASELESVLDKESYSLRQSASTGTLHGPQQPSNDRDFVADLLAEHGGSIGDLDLQEITPETQSSQVFPKGHEQAPLHLTSERDMEQAATLSSMNVASTASSSIAALQLNYRGQVGEGLHTCYSGSTDVYHQHHHHQQGTENINRSVGVDVVDLREDDNCAFHDSMLHQKQMQQEQRHIRQPHPESQALGIRRAKSSSCMGGQAALQLQQQQQRSRQSNAAHGAMQQPHYFFQQAPHMQSTLEQRRQRIMRYRQKRRDFAPNAGARKGARYQTRQ